VLLLLLLLLLLGWWRQTAPVNFSHMHHTALHQGLVLLLLLYHWREEPPLPAAHCDLLLGQVELLVASLQPLLLQQQALLLPC
jgi:hypothetical protein